MSDLGNKDLTRWNRAGLGTFRYTDGNALTYLETLRQALVEGYSVDGKSSWEALQSRFPVPDRETRRQQQERLRKQYYDERRDYAWEILRTFSRSAHVLGEYIDAYANEGYLPTAREWDSVRKLVAMLGYRPAPPSSAQTELALLLKPDQVGTLARGFAVKNKPAAGASTAIFETLQDLDADSRLNRLQLHQWNMNLAGFAASGKYDLLFELPEPNDDVGVGNMGVLSNGHQGVPVVVQAVMAGNDTTTLGLQVISGTWPDGSYRHHNTRLHLSPALVATPLPHGTYSVVLDKDTALSSHDVVITEQDGVWQARRITDLEKRHLRFEEPGIPPAKGIRLFRALLVKRQSHPLINSGYPVYVLPDGLPADQQHFFDSSLGDESDVTIRNDAAHLKYIKENHGELLYYPDDKPIAEPGDVGLTAYRFAGKNKGLASGQWTWVRHDDGRVASYRIAQVDQEANWFSVTLQGCSGNIALLQGDFHLPLTAADAQINSLPAWEDNSTENYSRLRLDDNAAFEHLTIGRKLICANPSLALAVTLEDLISDGSGRYLHVSPPIHLHAQASSFTRHDTVIYGNVVTAGHGEGQPEKIVGNGDAATANQRFLLAAKDVSWIADAEFSAGVRADITLQVGPRTWKQVEDLGRSSAEDPHYQVVLREDGSLDILFGDGRQGRRLPTGADNVRVRYRTGRGADGNLVAGALLKIVRPDPLIEDFVAPLPSSGGADEEPASAMRERAPATVLALDRAVSLDDFSHLTAHHSMVWQAQAFERMPNRPAGREIEVVVVPAGGAVFLPGSDTAVTLEQYLKARTVPDIPLRVVSYQPLYMSLEVTVMIDGQAFNPRQVEEAIYDHLYKRLALAERRLGQALFRSEVIALLEQVEGVENAHCVIGTTSFSGLDATQQPRLHYALDGSIRRVSLQPGQLLHLDSDHFPLQVTTQSYQR